MATVCGEITDDILRNCDALPVGGVKQTILAINRADIENYIYDTANPLIVTDIELKTGTKAYALEVFKNGHKPSFTLVKGDYGDSYRHQIDTSIQVWDNATKAQVEGLFSGNVVILAENKQASGDARFEIYGANGGLSVADGATRNLGENQGVLTYTLQSEDDSLEPKIPFTFAKLTSNVYSYSATLAAFEALRVVAP